VYVVENRILPENLIATVQRTEIPSEVPSKVDTFVPSVRKYNYFRTVCTFESTKVQLLSKVRKYNYVVLSYLGTFLLSKIPKVDTKVSYFRKYRVVRVHVHIRTYCRLLYSLHVLYVYTCTTMAQH